MQDHHNLQLPIILSFLNDARGIIEGGKNRRWEVFKWTIALNTVLATAALTKPKLPTGLLLLSVLASLMGGFLIEHYDRRMTKARDRARNLVEWIRTNAYIDMYATMGENTLIPAGAKDTFERKFFFGTIAASVIAVAIAVSLK
jgi:hypothetical protein